MALYKIYLFNKPCTLYLRDFHPQRTITTNCCTQTSVLGCMCGFFPFLLSRLCFFCSTPMHTVLYKFWQDTNKGLATQSLNQYIVYFYICQHQETEFARLWLALASSLGKSHLQTSLKVTHVCYTLLHLLAITKI